jgi:hypothetical protein
MKFAIKILIAAAAVCAFAAPSSAYTINGTIPVGRNGIAVNLQRPIPTSNVKLTVTFPQPLSDGIRYLVTFCVGRKMTSCQPAIQVPGGQQIVGFYYYLSLSPPDSVWLGQGTGAAVPYVVDVEYLP